MSKIKKQSILLQLEPIKHEIYDKLNKLINNNYKINNTKNGNIIINGSPIIYKNEYWIVFNKIDLEISSLDLTMKNYYDDIKYKIKYVIDENINGTIIINKICSLHEFNSTNNLEEINCLYDEHLNIIFIKFYNDNIEYININNLMENIIINNKPNINFDYLINSDLLITWTDYSLETKKIISTDNKIIYDDNFINLPPILYLSSNILQIKELNDSRKLDYPCSGASVFNMDGLFIGIVSHQNENEIIILPVNLIKHSLNYIEKSIIYKFNFELTPINILLRNNDDNIKICGFYKKNTNQFTKNIIISIDNYSIISENELLINNQKIPINTYLWLLKEKPFVKIQSIQISNLENLIINNDNDTIIINNYRDNLRYYNSNIKLSDNIVLSVSKLNYIKYNNLLLVELNEKIMQILKILITDTDIYDYFYDSVIKNLYLKKKIIILIDDKLNIKIIKKIKNRTIYNIETVIKYFKNKTKLKKYILSI